ncbi:theta glutathione s-transferase [Plakobranchus ocellatus]|uniref:Theta glutathione s-transferase n=1 Tax=Plakobranchus ocellatus TaxID=259542 RepID=A0AAV4AH88_9GAST|nr:theta glutathione s-transferase [Plakobranchus ocellatus]
MPLRLYYDLLSQPSRTAYMLLKMNKISFEAKEVDLMKGEHKAESFKKENQFGLVPFLDDDGFKVIESVAILKYIIGKNKLPDHWYPSELKAQTRVEEYLRWYPSNTRSACVNLFLQLVMIPKFTGNPVDQEAVKGCRDKVTEMIADLESYFLRGKKFIAGDKISIADLLGVCELVQLYGCHEHELYEKSPVVKAWVENVKQETNPCFDEAMVKIHHIHKVFLTEYAQK